MGSSWQSFRKELYLIETKMALTYAVVLCFSVLLLDDNGVRAFIFPTAESYSFSRVTKKSLVTKESINNFPTANFVCNYDHKALLSLATSRIDTDSLSSSAATINRSPIADEIDGWDANFYPTFLSKYWQKKPLFIRNAIPAVNNKLGINRDLIFQLSRFDDVETRLITKNNGKWTKSYGPFTEKKLSELTMSKDSWTILVQEIDRHLPVVADLWDKYFNFIPSWRRDDVMVSYSIPGGGIGAHVDNYDVFLVQGK